MSTSHTVKTLPAMVLIDEILQNVLDGGGWGKIFNRKRAFCAFSLRRSKTSPDDKMRKSGCSIAGEYSLYIQSPWARWNETLWREI